MVSTIPLIPRLFNLWFQDVSFQINAPAKKTRGVGWRFLNGIINSGPKSRDACCPKN